MRSWHPVSKVVLVVGLAVLVITWWTDQGAPDETVPAARRISDAEAANWASDSKQTSRMKNISRTEKRPLKRRTLPPELSFKTMVERPLFAPGRRLYVPDVEVDMLQLPETVNMPVPPAVQFIGSVVEDGAVRALVRDGFNVWGVTIGADIHGWSVLDIEVRRLILGFEDARVELTILE